MTETEPIFRDHSPTKPDSLLVIEEQQEKREASFTQEQVDAIYESYRHHAHELLNTLEKEGVLDNLMKVSQDSIVRPAIITMSGDTFGMREQQEANHSVRVLPVGLTINPPLEDIKKQFTGNVPVIETVTDNMASYPKILQSMPDIDAGKGATQAVSIESFEQPIEQALYIGQTVFVFAPPREASSTIDAALVARDNSIQKAEQQDDTTASQRIEVIETPTVGPYVGLVAELVIEAARRGYSQATIKNVVIEAALDAMEGGIVAHNIGKLKRFREKKVVQVVARMATPYLHLKRGKKIPLSGIGGSGDTAEEHIRKVLEKRVQKAGKRDKNEQLLITVGVPTKKPEIRELAKELRANDVDVQLIPAAGSILLNATSENPAYGVFDLKHFLIRARHYAQTIPQASEEQDKSLRRKKKEKVSYTDELAQRLSKLDGVLSKVLISGGELATVETEEILNLQKQLGKALKIISENIDSLDDMNVFPVVDGDTGKNMEKTLGAIIDALKNAQSYDDFFSNINPSSISGNSGKIIFGWMKGFIRMMQQTQNTGLNNNDRFAYALMNGADQAARSLTDPKPGFGLDVMLEVAELARTQQENLFQLLPTVLQSSIEKTRRRKLGIKQNVDPLAVGFVECIKALAMENAFEFDTATYLGSAGLSTRITRSYSRWVEANVLPASTPIKDIIAQLKLVQGQEPKQRIDTRGRMGRLVSSLVERFDDMGDKELELLMTFELTDLQDAAIVPALKHYGNSIVVDRLIDEGPSGGKLVAVHVHMKAVDASRFLKTFVNNPELTSNPLLEIAPEGQREVKVKDMYLDRPVGAFTPLYTGET